MKASSLGGLVSDKLRSFLRCVPAPQAFETVDARAGQSTRIKIRLLAQEGNFTEIHKIAESTHDLQIAELAVSELAVMECGTDPMQVLGRLARSYSMAAVPAIIALLNAGFGEEATSIFKSRQSNGDLTFLVSAGMARVLSIQSIMGYLDPQVAQAIKLRAVDLNFHCSTEEQERALWYATRDSDDMVAYKATVALIDHWQNQAERPAGLERFPLSDLGLLFHLSSSALSFQWHRPGAQQSEEQRIRDVQRFVDQITALLQLPAARLSIGDDDAIIAAYYAGHGFIEINRNVLFQDTTQPDQLISTLLHELQHMEQDVLVVRLMADNLALAVSQSCSEQTHAGELAANKLNSDSAIRLWERYSAWSGQAPDPAFLLHVLRVRNDQPLNADEKRRASRLYEDAQHSKAVHKQFATMKRLNRLKESHAALTSRRYDLELMACTRERELLSTLVQQGQIPAILVEEFDRFSNWMSGSGHCAELELIIRRMKAVLLQLISEEDGRLEEGLAEARRSGYHEAEAYAVSDRVEVIVKALQKNWYQTARYSHQ